MTTDQEAIIEAVTDPRDGRGMAKALASRLRFGVTQEERDLAREAIVTALRDGWTGRDGKHRTPGPRTRVTLVKALAEMNAQDMKDQHHLEGQKVNLTATISKPPDEEAADLLAEMRRRDLTPRAN